MNILVHNPQSWLYINSPSQLLQKSGEEMKRNYETMKRNSIKY